MRMYIGGPRTRHAKIADNLVRLCESQNWRCAYCTVRFVLAAGANHHHAPSFDEVIPRTLGGQTTWENRVAACRGCNSTRGHKDAEYFYRIVAAGEDEGRQRRRLADLENSRPPHQSGNLIPRQIGDTIKVELTPARRRYFEMVYGHLVQ